MAISFNSLIFSGNSAPRKSQSRDLGPSRLRRIGTYLGFPSGVLRPAAARGLDHRAQANGCADREPRLPRKISRLPSIKSWIARVGFDPADRPHLPATGGHPGQRSALASELGLGRDTAVVRHEATSDVEAVQKGRLTLAGVQCRGAGFSADRQAEYMLSCVSGDSHVGAAVAGKSRMGRTDNNDVNLARSTSPGTPSWELPYRLTKPSSWPA